MCAAALLSCAKQPGPAADRVALLPFENLTGDPQWDWTSAAVPAVLAGQLAGLARTAPIAAGALRDGYAQAATRAIHGYVAKHSGGIRIYAAIEDLTTHRQIFTFDASGQPLLPMIATLASHIDSGARPFALRNDSTLRKWAEALRSGSGFDEVAAEAPDFGLNYVTWAEARIARRDRDGALTAVDRGLARTGLQGPLDAARLRLLKADLTADAVARAEAFAGMSKAAPGDAMVKLGAANALFQARRFAEAADAFASYAKLMPDDAAALNLLGYAQALNGDLTVAKTTLEAYGKRPGQFSNSLDSLGEIHFLHGKFAEAEKYFEEAHRRDPQFLKGWDLYKASLARLLAGDAAGAERLFRQYTDTRVKAIAGPQTLGPQELLLAQWDWQNGRAEAAIQRIRNRPEFGPQLAIFENDPARLPPPFALLAARKFGEALPMWRRAYESASPPVDGLTRTMYAWCLIETGQRAAAQPLLRYYPLPQQSDGLFGVLIYPRFSELRRR